jgi:hypothetical protein
MDQAAVACEVSACMKRLARGAGKPQEMRGAAGADGAAFVGQMAAFGIVRCMTGYSLCCPLCDRNLILSNRQASDSRIIKARTRRFPGGAMADKKTFGHLSQRVAALRQSFQRPNMVSMRLRRL